MTEYPESRNPENLLLPPSAWAYWFIAPLAGIGWGFFLIRLLSGYPLVLPHLTVALLTLLCGLLLGRRQWRGGREIYALGLWGVVIVLMLTQRYTAGVAFLLFGFWLPGHRIQPLAAKLFFVAFFAGCAAGYFMAGNGLAALTLVLVLDFVFNAPLQKWWKLTVLLLFAAVFFSFLNFAARSDYLNAEKVTRTQVPTIAVLCGIGCTDPAENVPQVMIVTADKTSKIRKKLAADPIALPVEFADVNIRDTDKSFGIFDLIVVEDFRSGSSEFASRILANMSKDTLLVAPEKFAMLAPQLKWQTLPGEGKDKFVIARRGSSLRIDPEDIEKRLLTVSDNNLCPAGTFYGLMIDFQSTHFSMEKTKTPPPAASRWWLLLLPLVIAAMEIFSRRKKYDATVVGCWENGFALAIFATICFTERGEMSSGSQIIFLVLTTVWLAASLPLRNLPLLILKLAAAAMALLGICGYSAMIKGAFICTGMVLAVGNDRVRNSDRHLKLPAALVGMICGLILSQGLLFWQAVNLPQLLAVAAALLIWSLRLLSFHEKRK